MPWYLLGYAVLVPTGILGFYICSWLWIGFDAPFWLTAVRLAAVFAVADCVRLIVEPIPLLFIPWLISLGVYIGMLAKLLDIEWQEAAVVALVTTGVRIAIGIGLAILISAVTN
ncbi:MAG TPA: hypothetical protein DEB06_06545 [Phycisphaerales bacterium]|nr:hypothetical protein [Phycisphaerales bacterium]